jgi:hypothetical protein
VRAGAERGGPLQQSVRTTIGGVGGYWRPLAAVARVLEELGELAESLDASGRDRGEHAAELADLWIITTALADQFLADVADPRACRVADADAGARGSRERARAELAELLAVAAQIARVVNYYDGPKTPRDPLALPSLASSVERFHGALDVHARAHEVDLRAAVQRKLAAIATRDAGRFMRADSDPSTAPCLDALRAMPAWQLGLDPIGARLWGATVACASCLPDGARELAPALTSFARAATRERLEGLAIEGPARVGCGDAEWARRLLTELAALDPLARGNAHGAAFAAVVEQPFSFAGTAMSARIVPAQHGGRSSRPIATAGFLLLRPLDGGAAMM